MKFALAAKILDVVALLSGASTLEVLMIESPSACCITDSLFVVFLSGSLQILRFLARVLKHTALDMPL